MSQYTAPTSTVPPITLPIENWQQVVDQERAG